jgi:hypothetical protein
MKNAARFLSFLLILVALFGLVTAGLSAKDALDSKNYYEKAGKENDANMKAMDDGLKQLEENEQAYVEGKAALEQGSALVEGIGTLQEGYTTWHEGYAAFAAAYPGQPLPDQLAEGQKQLADGLAAAVAGVMANEEMAAAVQQSSGMTAEQINQTMSALSALPAEQFDTVTAQLLAVAGQLSEGVSGQLEEGKAQLKQYEDGAAQLKTALDAVIANPADPGLKSIASRLGEGFTYLKENGTNLDLTKAREVWNAWHAYSDDSGKVITKEIMTRVIAAAALVLAALLALIAAIRGLRGKGCKLVSFLAALLGCGAFAALKIAGSYFSDKAGASAVTLVMIGAIAVGACSLLHWILPRGKKD